MALKPEQKEFSKQGSNVFVPATPPDVTFPITLKGIYLCSTYEEPICISLKVREYFSTKYTLHCEA